MQSEPNQSRIFLKRIKNDFGLRLKWMPDSVKHSLEELRLKLPDADKPFRVVCVASNFAIGRPPIKTDDDSNDCVILYPARLPKATEMT